jgi:hypothetical protein
MSAWGIGRRQGGESLDAGPDDAKAFVDRVVQWIPADVVAIYTVGITTLRTQSPDPNPSPLWLGLAAILAFGIVLLSAQRTRKEVVRRDYLLAFMAVIAFAIWSLAIPDSGWYDWHLVADNPGWVALIAALGGLVFGALADTFVENG